MSSSDRKSFEREAQERIERGEVPTEKLDIPLLKYFWSANPLTNTGTQTIPKFLRSLSIFHSFSDNELRILSKFLHLRKFSSREVIFQQNEAGIGLYFLVSGQIDIIVHEDPNTRDQERLVSTLESGDYFGELALLQEHSVRSASAISRDHSELLGIFKPDVEELILEYPIVATKLIQSISLIVANRLYSITHEVKKLKFKIRKLEDECETLKSRD